MRTPFPDSPADKDHWRHRSKAARRARPTADLVAAQQQNLQHLLHHWAEATTVCLYAPLPREPLPADAPEQLAAAGVTVLVPITDRDRPLDWAALPTRWEPGPFGIRTPLGPRLGPEAVRHADAVIVPASLVDREGYRLGRGGGYYDRTLELLDDLGRVTAALFDDELIDDLLPRDPHDCPVGAVLRPTTGRTPL